MHVAVTHWQEDAQHEREDALSVEEPFEVRMNHRNLAVIMRTPGHDRELAMGFLYTERIITRPDDVLGIEEENDADGLPLPNVVNIVLCYGGNVPSQQSATFERHFAVSSSCGLCGKTSITDLLSFTPSIEPALDDVQFRASTLYGLPDRLRFSQTVFTYTGGLHAAGLFSATGELLLLREDVGRHNAVDKIIGYGLLHGAFPYSRNILLVSGRTSFEIIQKALLARIPCIAAISAPSSLAVELADRAGITLIGFLRDHSMNVYTHPERVI
ncbi:MAG: formate dehydrogenase accessory sulfurtransferase FdhD [Chloroflexi bacterium]|nr:MAG: formate dehydrogenase accessory sulfurtransferase FdhD [Chloroflexota bacterium]